MDLVRLVSLMVAKEQSKALYEGAKSLTPDNTLQDKLLLNYNRALREFNTCLLAEVQQISALPQLSVSVAANWAAKHKNIR